ncbi:hypothetical protein UVI_02037750 [Ustilaginoidea virens]|uniref:Uncharacterized protein n=1 Tax=Ustilaginoidea virens TaxID=1159556 RepID=A0A1B5KT91_USTVR|nr:hypothetical protein UVI_02037750 [Ustilaginoidea virens]
MQHRQPPCAALSDESVRGGGRAGKGKGKGKGKGIESGGGPGCGAAGGAAYVCLGENLPESIGKLLPPGGLHHACLHVVLLRSVWYPGTWVLDLGMMVCDWLVDCDYLDYLVVGGSLIKPFRAIREGGHVMSSLYQAVAVALGLAGPSLGDLKLRSVVGCRWVLQWVLQHRDSPSSRLVPPAPPRPCLVSARLSQRIRCRRHWPGD